MLAYFKLRISKQKDRTKTHAMSTNSLDLNLSAEAYESNDDSVGIFDVDSKISNIKMPPDKGVQSGSKYDGRTCPRDLKLQDEKNVDDKPTTVPPSSTKSSTKALSPRKAKKPRSIPPKMADTPDRNINPIPSSITTPPPPSK